MLQVPLFANVLELTLSTIGYLTVAHRGVSVRGKQASRRFGRDDIIGSAFSDCRGVCFLASLSIQTIVKCDL